MGLKVLLDIVSVSRIYVGYDAYYTVRDPKHQLKTHIMKITDLLDHRDLSPNSNMA